MRNLEEIVKEINNLDYEQILENTDKTGIYREWKKDKESHKEITKDEWLEDVQELKTNAINTITKHYKDLNESDSTDLDYEIAEYQVFKYYFNIIKYARKNFEKDIENKLNKFIDNYSIINNN